MNAQKIKIVILDGEKIENEKMLHESLKNKLNFPDYYGMNLHALWDLITGHIQLPIKIIWENFSKSKTKLGNEFTNSLIKLFDRAKQELNGQFDYELK